MLARPFAKFFNHGQPGAPELDLDAPVVVTDKADGSLGIIYPTPDGLARSRPAARSPRSRRGTRRRCCADRYAARSRRRRGSPYSFEIIYPANRIVLDYGGLDDLMLLGAVDIATGRSHGPDAVPRLARARSSTRSGTPPWPRRWPPRPGPTARAWSCTSPATGHPA